ncbi:protein serine/threonine kinase activating protein DBF4 [Sugiyamaella lignohabitans]|uniref:Protein serine/threonine kinase activating protein DBF4 n=1 Tax=Sugiyamaella lignohabitans TaxID=796027 RepID=A0A167FBY8_9ASCO|nr:protein serine/threonine kinase activating protein DBF4 [Sugiyamaella lignohabitans]ANB15093.1 protein serine/threonine kinase activating protein DBF4 [Sugiyamaella lignohabitans]
MDSTDRTPLKEQNTNTLRSPIKLVSSLDKQKARSTLASRTIVPQHVLNSRKRGLVQPTTATTTGASAPSATVDPNSLMYQSQHPANLQVHQQQQQQHHTGHHHNQHSSQHLHHQNQHHHQHRSQTHNQYQQQQQHSLASQQRHAREAREAREAALADSRDADEELRRWKEQWRKIMQSSVIYFDGIDQQNVDKVRGHLTSLGTQIQPFFERQVTHLVTKRSTSVDYPSTDVITKAKLLEMKVWSFDKLIRFLTHLLGSSPLERAFQPSTTNLSKLLKQEKLIGPSDRDMNAPTDSFKTFKGPYLLIWDPTHCFRPTLYKEFVKVVNDGEGDWPQFRQTPLGQCPFIYLSPKQIQMLEERSQERRKNLLSRQECGDREDEIEILDNAPGDDDEDNLGMDPDDEEQVTEETIGKRRRQGQDDGDIDLLTAATTRDIVEARYNEVSNGSLVSHAQPPHKKHIVDNSLQATYNTASRFYELAASGVNRSNMTSAVKSVAQSASGQSGTSTLAGGNGLAATVAQVPSRELANLQRKVLSRPSASVFGPIEEAKEYSQSASLGLNQDTAGTTGGNSSAHNSVSSRASGFAVRPSVPSKLDAQAAAAAAMSYKKKAPEPVRRAESKTQAKKRVGFCENCQIQFDDFDLHIISKRHRRFACDDQNFLTLDSIIGELQRQQL